MKNVCLAPIALFSLLFIVFSCQQTESPKTKKEVNNKIFKLIDNKLRLKNDQFWQELKEVISVNDETIAQLQEIDLDAKTKWRKTNTSKNDSARPNRKKLDIARKFEIKELLGEMNYLKYSSFEEQWIKDERKKRWEKAKKKRKSGSK